MPQSSIVALGLNSIIYEILINPQSSIHRANHPHRTLRHPNNPIIESSQKSLVFTSLIFEINRELEYEKGIPYW